MGVNKRPAEDEVSEPAMATETDAKVEASVQMDTSGDDSPPSAKKPKKSSPKKKKNKGLLPMTFPMQPKNPVALLNELRQNLVFDLVSQTGPVHAPVFTMKVTVDGVVYSGEGRSKKLAKLVAAKNALSSFLAQQHEQNEFLIQSPPFATMEFNRGVAVVDVDFTSDDPADANFIINTMNRMQPPTNAIQISLQETGGGGGGGGGPLTALPANGTSNSNGSTAKMKQPLTKLGNGEGMERSSGVDSLGKEEHNDSGHIEPEQAEEEEEGQSTGSEEEDEDEEGVEKVDTIKVYVDILEIIRISVDFYIDYEEEVQYLAKQQKLIQPEKGPVMLLYELFNDIAFECVQTDGGQFSRFKMRVTVNDEVFEGTGPSKRLAKTAAAKAALAQLRNISYSPMQTKLGHCAMDMSSASNTTDQSEAFGGELPQLLADAIGKMVQDKFAELMVGQEMYAKRKVLAGIVMTENGQIENAKVISVSTGTKCINGEHISIIGAVVNDCHAEIISRRCLMVFLYSQLRLLFQEDTKSQSIFEECPDRKEFYQLKPGIEFHLYINTAPCGDARIFSPHDAENNNVDKHPNRKARGQLRTKIESGEGTIPAKNNSGLQTWDGVIQGQRLLTMSCSDKIAKWNVMGIQGSLLASLVKPIYLSSIVLGSLLHPAHMYRAVCGRVEAAIGGELPAPYYLNRPKLALVTSAETRNQLKAPNFSVNWSCGDAEVEIINSVTGKTIQSQVSRISKQMFIVRYMSAAQHLKSNPPKLESEYGELKASVKEYQDVKDQLYKAFEKEDLGTWLKKPQEQDQFTCQH